VKDWSNSSGFDQFHSFFLFKSGQNNLEVKKAPIPTSFFELKKLNGDFQIVHHTNTKVAHGPFAPPSRPTAPGPTCASPPLPRQRSPLATPCELRSSTEIVRVGKVL
jgi:hypothetical protein